jgi:hypothetical protein
VHVSAFPPILTPIANEVTCLTWRGSFRDSNVAF